MSVLLRVQLLGFLILPCIGLLSCGVIARSDVNTPASNGNGPQLPGLFKPALTSIQDLGQLRPNTSVHLEGKVGRQAPFLGSRAYELQDATGSIWVLTTRTDLKPGATVVIRGRLQQQRIQIGGQVSRELYIQEDH